MILAVVQYLLRFYNGNRGIGGHDLGSGYIVSDSTVNGFWSQTVPADDICALAPALGLTLQEK
jgi:hypothetical protein